MTTRLCVPFVIKEVLKGQGCSRVMMDGLLNFCSIATNERCIQKNVLTQQLLQQFIHRYQHLPVWHGTNPNVGFVGMVVRVMDSRAGSHKVTFQGEPSFVGTRKIRVFPLCPRPLTLTQSHVGWQKNTTVFFSIRKAANRSSCFAGTLEKILRLVEVF